MTRWLLIALASVLGCGVSSDVSREVGARCDERSECDDRCLPPDDFPGGFCSTSCETSGDCPSDAACVDTEGGVCLFRCIEDPDCEFLGAGWSCQALPTRADETTMVMVCAPG